MSDTKRVELLISDHIAHVKLARPDKLNALDLQMLHELIAVGHSLEANASVRCVVLSGLGKAFCSGLDISMFTNSKLTEVSLLDRTYGQANMWQQSVWVWRDLAVPVVAAIHGKAFGGGLQLMAAADIVFVHPDTQLSIMELKWGIVPDMGGTQLWRHRVRDDILREMVYTHRIFSGKDAFELGFATHQHKDPLTAASALALKIAAQNPSAVVKAKKMLNEAPYLSVADGLLAESKAQQEIIGSHNQVESVLAQWQSRKPDFKDFRDQIEH